MTTKTTSKKEYTEGLISRQSKWWKTLFNVQAPYRFNIRRLKPGFVLDVGCGIGRNLLHLDGYGIGVDHNAASVEVCKQRGLTAFTVEDFKSAVYNEFERFDSLLFAHVAEHMTANDFANLLIEYLPFLKKGGKVIVITPQEYGYRSDDTHIQFMDFEKVKDIVTNKGLTIQQQYSFPFPRFVGKMFKFNEFVSVAIKP